MMYVTIAVALTDLPAEIAASGDGTFVQKTERLVDEETAVRLAEAAVRAAFVRVK